MRLEPLLFPPVQRRIPFRHFERWPRAVHAGDARSFSGGVCSKVQRKSALIAESVERFPLRVLRHRRVILPLIEKRSGFLAFETVVMKAHATVHGEDGRSLFSPKQPLLTRRQLLKLSNARIHALHDSRRLKFLFQSL